MSKFAWCNFCNDYTLGLQEVFYKSYKKDCFHHRCSVCSFSTEGFIQKNNHDNDNNGNPLTGMVIPLDKKQAA